MEQYIRTAFSRFKLTYNRAVYQKCCFQISIDLKKFQISTNKMQRFLIYLFLQTLYMLQAEEPPETCRASVETNKLRNVASCW